MVPEEIQQEMKNLYCALCELLRHFWACFPTTTKALEDKVHSVVFFMQKTQAIQACLLRFMYMTALVPLLFVLIII